MEKDVLDIETKKEDIEKNKKNYFGIYCLCAMCIGVILMFFIISISKSNIKVNTNDMENYTFTTNHPISYYTYLSNTNENSHYIIDNDENIILCVFDNYEQIDFQLGDYFKCGSYLDKNGVLHIAEIDRNTIDYATHNNTYITSSTKQKSLVEDDTWIYIHNNEIKREQLWEEFLSNCKNNKKSIVKIADNTLDGLILTIICFDGDKYYAIEDTSNIWVDKTNENTNLYITKKYLEKLELNNSKLWYLTDEQGIGSKLLQDGTLANIINGTIEEDMIVDMYWIWSHIQYEENEELEMWKIEYENYFPKIKIKYKEKDTEGTPFVLGEGENSIIGTTGGKIGEEIQEELTLSSAFIKKNDVFEKNVKLEGKHPLVGDLSSYVVVCDIDGKVTISIENFMDGEYNLKLWNGSDMGNTNATPILDTLIKEEYSFTTTPGITFGEITYIGIDNSCSWNFTINAN